jgi:hypothetical protein
MPYLLDPPPNPWAFDPADVSISYEPLPPASFALCRITVDLSRLPRPIAQADADAAIERLARRCTAAAKVLLGDDLTLLAWQQGRDVAIGHGPVSGIRLETSWSAG